MTTMSIFVLICIRGLFFMNRRHLESPWAPLRIALWIVVKLLCYFFVLFDAIIELHAMNEKMFNDFFTSK